MASFRKWLKHRFQTFDLLGDYFMSIKSTGWDLLWGASVISIVYCAWWFFEIPPGRVTVAYFLGLIFISGYYLWRADHIRLTPKFTVRGLKLQPTPTINPENQFPNGTSIYVQLLLRCEVPIEDCIGNLREVRIWSNETRQWEETEMNESLLLHWSHGDERPPRPNTLRPKNERRLNVYFTHDTTGPAINMIVYPIPARMATVFLQPDRRISVRYSDRG